MVLALLRLILPQFAGVQVLIVALSATAPALLALATYRASGRRDVALLARILATANLPRRLAL